LIHNYLLSRPRFHLHFTPISSSWLNLVERCFGLITEKRIRRGIFRSTTELEEAIQQYLETYNTDSKPFVWKKSADQILQSVKRYCELINDSEHYQLAFFIAPLLGSLAISRLVLDKYLLGIGLTACSVLVAFLLSLTLKEPPHEAI
jgi:hypothetical protein